MRYVIPVWTAETKFIRHSDGSKVPRVQVSHFYPLFHFMMIALNKTIAVCYHLLCTPAQSLHDHSFLGPWHQKSGRIPKDFMIDLGSEGTLAAEDSSTPATPVPRQLYDSTHPPHPLPHVVRDDRPTDGPGTVNS